MPFWPTAVVRNPELFTVNGIEGREWNVGIRMKRKADEDEKEGFRKAEWSGVVGGSSEGKAIGRKITTFLYGR